MGMKTKKQPQRQGAQGVLISKWEYLTEDLVKKSREENKAHFKMIEHHSKITELGSCLAG